MGMKEDGSGAREPIVAKPYDASLNDLIGAGPDDWAAHFAALAGIPPGPAEPLDTDLATTVQADRVFRIGGAAPAVLHLELESSSRLGTPHELLRYNTLIDHHYGLPVETVLILLRPAARATDRTGVYVRRGPAGNPITEFRYHVERVWERPADYWLGAGVALAPLALLTDEACSDFDGTATRFRDRLFDPGVTPTLRRSVVGSSYFLCGLRHSDAQIAQTFERFSMTLEDSTTYQATIAKGRAQGIILGKAEGVALGQLQSLQAMLRRQGAKRFGPPPAEVSAALDGIADVARLERLTDRVLDATGWDDLLNGG